MEEKKEHIELFDSLKPGFDFRDSIMQSLNDVRKKLVHEIRVLLDKNVERLFSILYRLDVSQKVTERVFELESKDAIAESLADAIIERQLHKIKTRKEYKNNP